MTATTIGIDLHIQELRQVATDLRNERELGTPKLDTIGRMRLAIGEALVQLGIAVAAGSPRTSTQAR